MITIQLRGGLGNQLFEYAAARALSIKNNVQLLIDKTYLEDHGFRKKKLGETSRNVQLDTFNINGKLVGDSYSIHNKFLRVLTEGRFKKLAKIYYEKKIGQSIYRENGILYNENFDKLGPNTYLIGYYQSEKYFSQFADQIRKDLTLVEEIPNKAKEILEIINSSESICINVRRGDYLTDALLKPKTSNYYIKGLEHIVSKIDKKDEISIIVVSDDIDRCKKNLSFDFQTIFLTKDFSGKKDEFHFELMSNCKHFVGSNSSYLWRAIWKNWNPSKIIVLPKERYSDPNINDSDIIPDYRNAIRF